MRELLEAIAISECCKIYNHECYSAFLTEILKQQQLGTEFNNFRIIRNDINYYGKDIKADEARIILQSMDRFIKRLKNLI